MAITSKRLWRIVQIDSVAAIAVGVFYLVMPPAWSSAMVENLQQVAPEQQFDVARDSFLIVFGLVAATHILFGIVALVCCGIALRREACEKHC